MKWQQPIVGTWQIGEGPDTMEITQDNTGWLLQMPDGELRQLAGVDRNDAAGARQAAARYVLRQGRRLVRLGTAGLDPP